MPSIWSVIGSSSLYENSKTGVSSAAFSRNSDCYLHRRYAAPSSTEQGTAKDVCTGGSFLGKAGLPGQDREMLSHPIPGYCVSRGQVGLNNNDTISLPQPKLSTILDTCQVLLTQGCVPMRTLSTLIGRMSHASQTGIMMAPLYYRGLQRLHLQTVAQHGHGSRVSVPLNYQALADLKWWVSESEHLNGCPVQQPPIDATIWSDASKTGWGVAYQGISTRGHWSVEEAQAHINVLELRAATLALKALLKHQLPVPKHVHLRLDNTTAVAYINKPDHSGTRTVGSSPGSRCIRDSSAYSRDSEWSSRHSLQGARQQNRVDSGQTDLSVNLSEVLHTGSGPLCVPPDSSSPQVCLVVPGSWGSSRGCLSPGLEQMVLSNPPSCSPSSSYPQEDKRRSGDSSSNCTQLVWTTMVPRANSNACRSASTSTPVSIPGVPSISTCSTPAFVAVSSSSSLTLIRSRYEATGFSKEVVDILLASRGAATQKR